MGRVVEVVDDEGKKAPRPPIPEARTISRMDEAFGWLSLKRFNPMAFTAASRTLPFGSHVRVTNLENGHSVIVLINDRGSYVEGRMIDLSVAPYPRRSGTISR
jgi:Lytic transglycolase